MECPINIQFAWDTSVYGHFMCIFLIFTSKSHVKFSVGRQ